jgi:ABC-type proline/glycine betaine transport system substrate-binding protein
MLGQLRPGAVVPGRTTLGTYVQAANIAEHKQTLAMLSSIMDNKKVALHIDSATIEGSGYEAVIVSWHDQGKMYQAVAACREFETPHNKVSAARWRAFPRPFV